MDSSLDAEAILRQVREGNMPDTWRVYRARASALAQWPIFGVMLLGAVALVIIRTAPTADRTTRVVEILVIVLFTLLGLRIIWFGVQQFANLHEQMLVLTPDGFVINTATDVPVVFAFAAIQSIRVRSGRYGTSTSVLLAGSNQRQPVPLDFRFGAPLRIAKQIGEGLSAWQRTHGGT